MNIPQNNQKQTQNKSSLSISLHLQMCILYLRQKKQVLAISCFNKILKINPKDYIAYYNLGIVYNNMNQLSKAEQYYRKSIQFGKMSIRGYLALSRLYCYQCQYIQSQRILKSYIEASPKDLNGLYELGKYYQMLDNYEQSRKIYEKILSKNPQLPKIYCKLGDLFYQQLKYEQAKNKYIQAYQKNTNYIEPKYKLALVYQKLKQYNEALRQIQFCIKKEPEIRKYRYTKSKIEEQMDTGQNQRIKQKEQTVGQQDNSECKEQDQMDVITQVSQQQEESQLNRTFGKISILLNKKDQMIQTQVKQLQNLTDSFCQSMKNVSLENERQFELMRIQMKQFIDKLDQIYNSFQRRVTE